MGTERGISEMWGVYIEEMETVMVVEWLGGFQGVVVRSPREDLKLRQRLLLAYNIM